MTHPTLKPPLARSEIDVGAAPPRLFRAPDASTALKFAFVGPALFLLVVGGVDLFAVGRSQDRLETIAAGAAAAGVAAIGPAADPAAARARAAAFVAAEMDRWPGHPAFDADYRMVEGPGGVSLHVALRGHRPSFLANMLPPGGWRFTGAASATPTRAVQRS
ncbi:MAG: hypothetical protein ACK4VY_04115 [Brevundimonas sp.]